MKKLFTVHHLGFSWNGMIMAWFTMCMLNWEHHLVLSLGFWTLVYSVYSWGIFGNVFYQLSAVWDLFSNGFFFLELMRKLFLTEFFCDISLWWPFLWWQLCKFKDSTEARPSLLVLLLSVKVCIMYDALLLFALLSGLKEMVLLMRELNLALHFLFQISLSCVSMSYYC